MPRAGDSAMSDKQVHEISMIRRSRLEVAGIVLALFGGIGQLAITLMGFAIGGPGITVWLLLGDAVLAILGAIAIARWPTSGASLVLLAGAGALVALFSFTLLESGVAILLLSAAALGFASRRSL